MIADFVGFFCRSHGCFSHRDGGHQQRGQGNQQVWQRDWCVRVQGGDIYWYDVGSNTAGVLYGSHVVL